MSARSRLAKRNLTIPFLLYWIKGRGNFRQFVFNRVQKIQQHRDVKWHYVPTTENPADLESRGGNIVNHPLWSHGPSWPSEAAKWPSDIILEASPETEKEMKVTIGRLQESSTFLFTELCTNG
jgi:hypothetical protein